MSIEELKNEALKASEDIKTVETLENFRVKYLGRKSELTNILRSLKDLSVEEKRILGPEAQKFKKELDELIDFKSKEISLNEEKQTIDITRPGQKMNHGHAHILAKIESEMRDIFTSMNFSVIDGAEIQSEYNNFDSLNFMPSHPAREMHDTFWIKQTEAEAKDPKKHLLLRTHISSSQVQFMEKNNPPFQFVSFGRVFRYEASDATHESQFHYMEGMMVGKKVNLANFKFVIEEFFRKLFPKRKLQFRYRPSYFPFVEPGIEVDINIGNKWLEVMGAGMVHPNVFEAAHYNPRDIQGFAFGVGIDRLAIIKYKVPDIRLFYSGDLRFINQF
jgi:phenylalanyl-tRNA synthetase alpha chain